MNKKGEKFISVYWFVILFIVAAAVSYMVISFYGNPYDVREAEVDALTDKVARCMTEGAYLGEGVLSGGWNENFLENCGLNFNVEDVYDWQSEDQYYVEAGIYDFENSKLISSFKGGNENLKQDCELGGENFPVCIEREFYSLDKENNQYRVEILSIVKKVEKNVQ